MIVQRPTLPIGYLHKDLPEVAAVLHSEREYEIYRLSAIDQLETSTLLLLRSEEFALHDELLAKWWAAQSNQMAKPIAPLSVADLPFEGNGMLLTLPGQSMSEVDLSRASTEILNQLFVSILGVAVTGLGAGLLPNFSPWLNWWSSEKGTLFSLFPSGDICSTEELHVRNAAKAFYRFATGIEFDESSGKKLALKSWSRFSSEQIDKVLARCLQSRGSKSAITTLEELSNALGQHVQTCVQAASKPNGLSDMTTSSSVLGKGLDGVAGMHSLKDLLRREVVRPLQNPEPYSRFGISIPNGMLLYGPPGCGKTYIARKLAEELGYYFVEIIPSELASPYIHGSVIRIRELFDEAAEQAPAIVFIDEFEALVPSRAGLSGFQQHKAEEVNEFLAHLNSCSEKRIFIIAATNQPDKIDPAVRRTGRLDKLIYVGPPDAVARHEMLSLHLKGRPVDPRLELGALAEVLAGYSASDIRFLVDEAARDALKRELTAITEESFRFAITKITPSVTSQIEEQYRTIEQRGL